MGKKIMWLSIEEYDRRMKRSYADVRSKSGDRDFRSEKYSGRETSRSRSDYPESQQRILSSPTEHRSVPVHRKESTHIDARKKLNMRRESDRELPPNVHPNTRRSYLPTEKRYSESLSRVDKHSDRRSPGMDLHKWSPKRRSPSRVEKVSEFSRRPDKYAYKSWSNDPDAPSHSSNYYEERNEGSDLYRGRGSSRPFRSSRGFRARSYRGSFSTRSNYRGGYRNSSTYRGQGGSRRGRFSPNLWEHDLYSRTPEDRKMKENFQIKIGIRYIVLTNISIQGKTYNKVFQRDFLGGSCKMNDKNKDFTVSVKKYCGSCLGEQTNKAWKSAWAVTKHFHLNIDFNMHVLLHNFHKKFLSLFENFKLYLHTIATMPTFKNF
ncbi:UNVERIFIED_CONTAM: hypothetical protein NCL1_33749 [Trichonephila clavipes]